MEVELDSYLESLIAKETATDKEILTLYEMMYNAANNGLRFYSDTSSSRSINTNYKDYRMSITDPWNSEGPYKYSLVKVVGCNFLHFNCDLSQDAAEDASCYADLISAYDKQNREFSKKNFELTYDYRNTKLETSILLYSIQILPHTFTMNII